jgi:hypothetical protein
MVLAGRSGKKGGPVMIEWIATTAALTLALVSVIRLPHEIRKLRAEAAKAEAEARNLDQGREEG